MQTPKTESRRRRKTTYRLWLLDPQNHEEADFERVEHRSRAVAITTALRHAAEQLCDVMVQKSTSTTRIARINEENIVCEPGGDAYVVPKRESGTVKYIRGHGKHRSAWR